MDLILSWILLRMMSAHAASIQQDFQSNPVEAVYCICAQVRVLFDGSCVEVFAGLSEDDVARGVLSTRIYRCAAAWPFLSIHLHQQRPGCLCLPSTAACCKLAHQVAHSSPPDKQSGNVAALQCSLSAAAHGLMLR